jgi:predicted nucleotidyltransferase
MSGLERALDSIVRFLDERRIPYMIIGGVANLVWGEPRATIDVDASVLVEAPAWPGIIRALRRIFRVVPKDPMAFLEETSVLPVQTAEGVRVDLLWARLPYEHKALARATLEDVAGRRVRVCTPEDLILHKIVSERSKDQEDVRAIVRQQAHRLDRGYLSGAVRELARALDRPDLLTFLTACFREAGYVPRPRTPKGPPSGRR